MDVWSSILVLWRFWGDPEGEGSYFLVTRRRESRASVGIAFTFVLIGYLTCWQVRGLALCLLLAAFGRVPLLASLSPLCSSATSPAGRCAALLAACYPLG